MNSDFPYILMSGPCQIESLAHSLMMAKSLKEFAKNHSATVLVFKSSFDKANRTSLKGVRGVGLEEGLEILAEVKKQTGLPIVTDIHEPWQAAKVAEQVDVLQIPAFLCRQTDLLIAAGETGRIVQIKKGQFLAPEDMLFAAEKVTSTGNQKVILCERGTCFGYRDLIIDFRSLHKMQDLGFPVIVDVSHSCMSMGGAGGKSGGARRFIVPYTRAAVAMGCQGIFIETHQDPLTAPSDGETMLPLDQFPLILKILDSSDSLNSLVAADEPALEIFSTQDSPLKLILEALQESHLV